MSQDECILIVEDDPEFRQVTCELLRSHGYKVVEAATGTEALLNFLHVSPDLVLLDVHLPGINGLEICQLLKGADKSSFLPIIFLSGSGEDEEIRGLEAGAYDFLTKPVRDEELIAKVKASLNIRRLNESMNSERKLLLSANQKQVCLIQDQEEKIGRLKRFFSPQVADIVLKSQGGDVGYHKREITVTFIDLRGFTAFAESTEPDEVVDVLSEYYKAVCGAALEHGGTVSTLAGDGIMIFFNDPVPNDRHTETALSFLFDVRARLGTCASRWSERNYSLGFGAGLASGEAIVGPVGFDQFVHYTAIGTVVNLAARLCKEARMGQVLATRRGLREVEQTVELEPAGEFYLKGIKVPVTALNVVRWKRAA